MVIFYGLISVLSYVIVESIATAQTTVPSTSKPQSTTASATTQATTTG